MEEEIQRSLRSELGSRIQWVEESDPEALRLSIQLIRPEPAEVPGFVTNLQRSSGDTIAGLLTLGLSQRSMEDQMVAIGVDRDRFRERQKAYEDGASDWGLFPKTAKRRRLQELGYAPLLFSGRYLLLDQKGTRGRGEGLFFGWETAKHMSPLPAKEHPLTEEDVVHASAKGLARYLKAQLSNR